MLTFAVIAASTVLIGFGRTFIVPRAQGSFERPWFVHVHAALFFVWIALLVVQIWLAARRQLRWHRRAGWIGVPLVPLMAASGIAVSVWATRRDLELGQAEALPFFFGLIMDMALFFAFGSAALAMRRRPAVHKRLILFATIAILGAAVARTPILSIAGNYVAVTLVLLIACYDIIVDRRIRPVSLVGSLLLLAGIFLQSPLGQTAAWERAGPVVLARLSLNRPKVS